MTDSQTPESRTKQLILDLLGCMDTDNGLTEEEISKLIDFVTATVQQSNRELLLRLRAASYNAMTDELAEFVEVIPLLAIDAELARLDQEGKA